MGSPLYHVFGPADGRWSAYSRALRAAASGWRAPLTIDLDAEREIIVILVYANNSFSVVNPIAAAFLNNRISQDVDLVTLRFNYRFGGYGSPFVAKY